MASKFLIHTYHIPGIDPGSPTDLLTLQLDDHWFRIPPDEPFEVDTDSNGRQLDSPEFYTHTLISVYGGIYGLTEITATKTRTGLVLDIDRAHDRARANLLMNRHRHINLWAQEQLKSRVGKGLPVFPPDGFVDESIRILNLDVERTYNIHPVGWDFKPSGPSIADTKMLTPVAPDGPDPAEELAALRAENSLLNGKFSQLEVMMQRLLDMQSPSKAYVQPPTPAQAPPLPTTPSTPPARK